MPVVFFQGKFIPFWVNLFSLFTTLSFLLRAAVGMTRHYLRPCLYTKLMVQRDATKRALIGSFVILVFAQEAPIGSFVISVFAREARGHNVAIRLATVQTTTE